MCTVREQLSVTGDKDTVLRVSIDYMVQKGSFIDRSGIQVSSMMISQPEQTLDGCKAGRWGWSEPELVVGIRTLTALPHSTGEQVRGRSVGHGQICIGEGRHQSHPAGCFF